MSEPNDLTSLSRTECLRLLASSDIGRVVFVDEVLPGVQPVVYLLDGEEIIYRTANGAKLAAVTRHAVIAFEVDDIDHQTRTGWSVVGVGQSYEIFDQERLAELHDRMPEPWVRDHDLHTIAIPLTRLTGRRINLAGGITPDIPRRA